MKQSPKPIQVLRPEDWQRKLNTLEANVLDELRELLSEMKDKQDKHKLADRILKIRDVFGKEK